LDWFQFGVLIIAHRNGEYFVVDGEHRLTAALSLEELDLLPCMLYDFDGTLHEAEIFIKLQVSRKSLVTRDLHKAELFIGGEFGAVAQKSQEFIESLDCESYPLSTIRLLRRQKSRAFTRIAPLIPELVGTATLRKDFIEAAVYLEDVLGKLDEPESLATTHRQRLFGMGYEPLVALMIAHEAQHRDGVAKIASPRMKAEALRWALFHASQ
jgi:hypothetical protein